MRSTSVEEPCKSALNHVSGMDFNWSLNPYTGCAHRCTFCYVRAFERRADRPSDDRYGASIRVKTNIAQILRLELERPSWQREDVVIGAATDPYQPVEGRYRLTRSCIETFAAHRNPFSIITRGPMIVRDVDVLQEGARRAEVAVNFSIPTLDPTIWRRTEPGTAPPRQRLRALKTLVDAGIKAGVGMAPILPGLSDRPELLTDVVKAARDAGARFIWMAPLHLRPGTKEHFLEHLADDWPELARPFARLYEARAYLPREMTEPIRDRFVAIKRRFPMLPPPSPPLTPPPDPVQLQLLV
jgi:DNA repair photolyase